jgi:hypothetical protein
MVRMEPVRRMRLLRKRKPEMKPNLSAAPDIADNNMSPAPTLTKNGLSEW